MEIDGAERMKKRACELASGFTSRRLLMTCSLMDKHSQRLFMSRRQNVLTSVHADVLGEGVQRLSDDVRMFARVTETHLYLEQCYVFSVKANPVRQTDDSIIKYF
uniref:Uncharacterized protein n=1 Tax=Sphaerodactylus townsendi TaxID=933632 RepID=A0ACB8EHN6_9SAUR